MAKFYVTKLDRRMNGYGTYSHKLDFIGRNLDSLRNLQAVRNWLWQNYGPGAELHLAMRDGFSWAWDTEHEHVRLYVNDNILTMLTLKWG